MRRVVQTLLFCLILRIVVLAQPTASICKQMEYVDRNQVDYGPLTLGGIQGRAKDAQGVAIANACVGIFAEADHRPVALTATDAKGAFQFKNVPGGAYRLVAEYPGFSPANAKIVVQPSRAKKKLFIRMRPARVDTASLVELK